MKSSNNAKTADWFGRFSVKCSNLMGSRWAFLAATLLLIGWAVTGPYYQYSDTWQLIINTGTNIITFIMVFLIQNTQNRDAKAINLKLNEIIRSIGPAHNDLIDVEKLSDEDLDQLAARYERIRELCEARRNLKNKQIGEHIQEEPHAEELKHVEKIKR